MVAARAFEAAIVLIAWSALYFGIKHYGTVEEQRNRLLASETTARKYFGKKATNKEILENVE
jgi:hypothetical protein